MGKRLATMGEVHRGLSLQFAWGAKIFFPHSYRVSRFQQKGPVLVSSIANYCKHGIGPSS